DTSEIQNGESEAITASGQKRKSPGGSDVTANLLAPQTQPSLTPAPQAPKGDPVQSLLNSVDAGSLSALLSPPLLNAPATGPAPLGKGRCPRRAPPPPRGSPNAATGTPRRAAPCNRRLPPRHRRSASAQRGYRR